jgi:predicted O-linked N-acetylglucosamine transferase (SPINDLY family)
MRSCRPVITWPAAQTLVQLTAGFFRYLNRTETIVHSLEEYIARAIAVDKTNIQPYDHQAQAQAQAHAPYRHDAFNDDAHHPSSRPLYADSAASDEWNQFLSLV